MSRSARHNCPVCNIVHMRSTPECAEHAPAKTKVVGVSGTRKAREPREAKGSESTTISATDRAAIRAETENEFAGPVLDADNLDKTYNEKYVNHLIDRIAKAENTLRDFKARCHCRVYLPMPPEARPEETVVDPPYEAPAEETTTITDNAPEFIRPQPLLSMSDLLPYLNQNETN